MGGIRGPLRRIAKQVLLDRIRDRIESKEYSREQITTFSDFCATETFKAMTYAVVGRTSITDMKDRAKYIEERSWKYTGPEMARTYLEFIIKESGYKRKTLGYSNRTIRYLDEYAPAYYTKSYVGPLAYVDIQSAFAQIYLPMTLDMHYCLEDSSFCGRGEIPFLWTPELLAQKKVRNSVIGCIKSNTIRHARKGKITEKRIESKTLAPDLWGYIMHTLHAVASDALECFGKHIRYINNDGYIVDLNTSVLLQEFLLEKWAFTSKVKGQSERGKLNGFGSFDIGTYKTRSQTRGGMPFTSIKKLDKMDVEKLRRWRIWSSGFSHTF